MWPKRPTDSPKWPTFRGAMLDDKTFENIASLLEGILEQEGKFPRTQRKLIYVAKGKQYVRESSNGGFVNGGGTRNCYNCLSFELEFKMPKCKDGKITQGNIYLIVWVGGYGKGSIMHCGWQFPHSENYDPYLLEQAALQTYYAIASLIYDGRPLDKEVEKFINLVMN
jgi:hypothetical protein